MSVEHGDSGHVFLMEEVPFGWTNAMLDQVQKMHEGIRQIPAGERARLIEDRRHLKWLRSTGRHPEESRFTVVVPIYNEERNLQSFIGAFLTSDLPHDVNMNMLFVVNGCTDNSRKVLTNLLTQSFGSSTVEEIPPYSSDPELHSESMVFKRGNQTFTILETPLACKANVLNIANEHAVYAGDDLVLSIDANNYVEPQTLSEILGYAYKNIRDGELVVADGIPVVSYKHCKDKLSNIYLHLSGRYARMPRIQDDLKSMNGWLMCWDPQWYADFGGLPLVGGDDRLLSMMARIEGVDRCGRTSSSRIWGYGNQGLDTIKAAGRWHREKLQTVRHYSEEDPETGRKIVNMLRKNDYEFKSLPGRILEAIKKTDFRSSRKIAKSIASFFTREISMLYGKYLYITDKDAKTWEPMMSTK